jgi:hypothetical protein
VNAEAGALHWKTGLANQWRQHARIERDGIAYFDGLRSLRGWLWDRPHDFSRPLVLALSLIRDLTQADKRPAN